MTLPPLPETLIWCTSPWDEAARGRDAVDLCLASLALGWETGLLLSDDASEWLWAQHAVADAAEPFARALGSLPLYDLHSVWVVDAGLRAWPALGHLPVQVLDPQRLPRLLEGVRRVLHP